MKGIKMSNCRFYVDEEARTVICVIPNTSNMVLDFIREHFEYSDIDFYSCTDYRLDQRLRMPHSFVGKAVCSVDDEWNEEAGKLIAFSRAKDKCYKSFFKRANTFVQTIDRRLGDIITEFNDFGVKLENKQEALQDQIKEYLPKTEEE